MLRRLPSLAIAVVLLAACSTNVAPQPSLTGPGQSPVGGTMVPTMTGSPTANPYAGLPSNACGGFHLEIVNERATAVRITINGSWSAQLTSGATQVITIAFTQPQPPRFPWDVSIADAASNVELFRATMTGPVDQKVVLSDAGATQGPYSLTAEGC